MVRMVAMDLDDTLMRDDKTVSELSLRVLERLRVSDIKTVFATGRSKKSALSMTPPEYFDGMVFQNGAVVYADNELIYIRLISATDTRKIAKQAEAIGIKVVAETDKTHYANANLKGYIDWISSYEEVDFNLVDVSAEQIMLRVLRPSDLQFLEAALPNTVYYEHGRENYVQIMQREATKLNGILALCNYYDIPIEDVVAFGDDTNDMSMMSGCGKGIAMGNAIPLIKDIADEICDTNQNDGMAKYIMENILQEE